MSNRITCPNTYKCTKLHKESGKVCCPQPEESAQIEVQAESRQQTSTYGINFIMKFFFGLY